MGKRTPFLAPHHLSQSTLGILFGATRQSVGFVIWPWQKVCGYHLLFYFCFFSFQSLIFLSFFVHVFLALALWLVPGFPWLSFCSFQCANNIVFLIFLLITVYFQGIIQSKCIESKEIFSTELVLLLCQALTLWPWMENQRGNSLFWMIPNIDGASMTLILLTTNLLCPALLGLPTLKQRI